MAHSLRIHLCSSNRDLASERNALLGWLEDCRSRTQGFTYFGSRTLPALDAALNDIAISDVAILVVGHLYGMMAPGHNRALEEREYEEAVKRGKTVLVYLREEEAGRIPGSVEKDPQKIPLLTEFRRRLTDKHEVRWFRDPSQLTAKIEEDLLALLVEHEMTRRPVSRQALRGRLRTGENEREALSDTPVIAPAQESETRTLPLLQKALSTPFSPGFQPRRKKMLVTVSLGVILLPLIALGIWRGQWIQRLSSEQKNEILPAPSLGITADTVGQEPAADSSRTLLQDSASALAPPPVPDPLTLMLDKAKDGDTTALLRIAEMYDSGLTLPQNDSLATSHYRRAASKGMTEAQYKLALRHLEGQGAKKNKGLAAFWLQSAAGKGHAPSQSKLGTMYLKGGQGVIRDEAQGLKWLMKAADQKDAVAESLLTEIKARQ